MITENSIYTINGVKIYEKIIPDGTVWTKENKAALAKVSVGTKRKAEKLVCGTGIPGYITIHTSTRKNIPNNAQTYVEATYNESIGSQSIVHLYVDENCAWQEARIGLGFTENDKNSKCEVTYHSGDTKQLGEKGGNFNSISIELLMDMDSDAINSKVIDNAIRIVKYLMDFYKIDIDHVVTHTYWVNIIAKNPSTNIDDLCTTPVKGEKWCPYYIFKSSGHKAALKNWLAFKESIKNYIYSDNKIKAGDIVRINPGSRYYSNGVKIPKWVTDDEWEVLSVNNNRIVVNYNRKHTINIMSPVNVFDCSLVLSGVKGDVNNDGEVDEKDAVKLERKLAGWDTSINEANADMNNDGEVDEKDAVKLERTLSGWDNG